MSSSLVLDNKTLSYARIPAKTQADEQSQRPGILFCGGFRSDMQGTKAQYLQSLCKTRGWQFTRFDYSGHGTSSGEFIDCGIDDWREDTLAMLEQVCEGPQVLVGSSMGLWMVLLATVACPQRVAAIVGIAGAPDFTERLIWEVIDAEQQAQLQAGVIWNRPSEYDDGSPYPIGMNLVESGRQWLVLGNDSTELTNIRCPIRLLHGTQDLDVPWQLSEELLEKVGSDDATLMLVKDADHRLSSKQHLLLLQNVLVTLMDEIS